MKFDDALSFVINEEREFVFRKDKVSYELNNKEGGNPHLHFYHNNDKGCIRIDEDSLFNHEDGMTGELNNNEKRELAIFFSLPSKKIPNITNYQYWCKRWNQKNIDANSANKEGKRLAENNKISPYNKYLSEKDIGFLRKIKYSSYYKE